MFQRSTRYKQAPEIYKIPNFILILNSVSKHPEKVADEAEKGLGVKKLGLAVNRINNRDHRHEFEHQKSMTPTA